VIRWVLPDASGLGWVRGLESPGWLWRPQRRDSFPHIRGVAQPGDTSIATEGGVLGGTVVWLSASWGASPTAVAPERAPVAEEVPRDSSSPGLAIGVSGLMATPDGSSRERILPDMRPL
jgi:hypothetical protein